jgi:hypothetical protein
MHNNNKKNQVAIKIALPSTANSILYHMPRRCSHHQQPCCHVVQSTLQGILQPEKQTNNVIFELTTLFPREKEIVFW